MRAIVIKQFGGPEVLALEERPDPAVQDGEVLIEVKAFGLNHAEVYFRQGAWGDVAEISGIECAGTVRSDPSGKLKSGQTVIAMVGGLGRSRNGSYAELVAVPASNVAAVRSDLSWERLAALPESYGTAWTALVGILGVSGGQTVLVRGATSALGQAAVNIAADLGCRVIGSTRDSQRTGLIELCGARETLLERPDLSEELRRRYPLGIDAVLDIVGNTTILDSLAMLSRGGEACLVGFLGGGGPLSLEPVFQIPSGRKLSVFASALVSGTADFPLTEIPFQSFAEKAASGEYRGGPAHVFRFEEIREAHRLIESGKSMGKIVVQVD